MLTMESGVSPLPSILGGRQCCLRREIQAGVNEERFYRKLVAKADERFDRHLWTPE